MRLPVAEKRRIKIMAASQGVTIRQAIHEAFDAWALQLQSRALSTRIPKTGIASSFPKFLCCEPSRLSG